MKWFHLTRMSGVWLLVGAVALATGGPAAADWKIVPKNGGNNSSWQIVPKGSPAASTGTKSPGFGSKPGTGFYEPSNNGPKRTSPVPSSGPVKVRPPSASSSAHEKAPSAGSNSASVKAPPAPDQMPKGSSNGGQKGSGGPKDSNGKGKYPGGAGKYPGGGKQVDPGHAGPPGKQIDPGFGKHPGHGGAWGKGHFIPVPFPVPSGGHYEQWTNSESEVPLAPPAPSAPLVVANPKKNGVTMPFLINSKTTELSAGEHLELPTDRAWEIKFDHGGGFGVARYSLTGGVYQFTYTDHGWELYNYAADASE